MPSISLRSEDLKKHDCLRAIDISCLRHFLDSLLKQGVIEIHPE
jgi:hypothetical protein